MIRKGFIFSVVVLVFSAISLIHANVRVRAGVAEESVNGEGKPFIVFFDEVISENSVFKVTPFVKTRKTQKFVNT